MAREMHGHVVTDNEGMISKLLNEDTMEKIISNTWGRMCSRVKDMFTLQYHPFRRDRRMRPVHHTLE